MGDNHPHPGCHGGCTGDLGVHRISDMASERIMSALNYSVHHSGCVRMKRSLLPKLSRNPPKRKDWPLGRFFCVSWEVTILPKAAPIMTPTTRSITFPLRVNSLSS